jgi:hypothetical protein
MADRAEDDQTPDYESGSRSESVLSGMEKSDAFNVCR